MGEETQRRSATIYQFPVGGRAGLTGAREAAKAADEVHSSRVGKIAFGGSWYHEAAIQDADQSRKR